MSTDTSRTAVNGVVPRVDGTAGTSLLAWLRDDLHLTGAKYACGEAQCGACSVLVDGALTRACVTPASDAVGRSVVTVEGLAEDDRMHPRAARLRRRRGDAVRLLHAGHGDRRDRTAGSQSSSGPRGDRRVDAAEPVPLRRVLAHRRGDRRGRGTRARRTRRPSRRRPTATAMRPSRPWSLAEPRDRDYFDVLGDGLVVVALAARRGADRAARGCTSTRPAASRGSSARSRSVRAPGGRCASRSRTSWEFHSTWSRS